MFTWWHLREGNTSELRSQASSLINRILMDKATMDVYGQLFIYGAVH